MEAGEVKELLMAIAAAFQPWSKGGSPHLSTSFLGKIHCLGLYSGKRSLESVLGRENFLPRVWARFRRLGFQPCLFMLRTVNQLQVKLGSGWVSKTFCL